MPARPKYRYIVSAPGGPYAFVPHPHLPGLWVRTHPSVLAVDCPHCNQKAGNLCTGSDGGVRGPTHWTRRKNGQKKVAELMAQVDTTVIARTRRRP